MLPIVVLSAFATASDLPAGRYVESRTAAVFAGACHYNGEYCADGREALCAWHFEQGRAGGEELAGVDLVLLLAADRNLAEPAANVARWVYLGRGARPAARQAALELLRAREPALFAGAEVLDEVPLELSFGADESYSVHADGRFDLAGRALADRACCRMPFQVWYRPFAAIEERVVGDNTAFAWQDERLGRVFSRPGNNCAFVGRFRLEAPSR